MREYYYFPCIDLPVNPKGWFALFFGGDTEKTEKTSFCILVLAADEHLFRKDVFPQQKTLFPQLFPGHNILNG